MAAYFVTAWVGQHGLTSGAVDPADGIAQCRPSMRDMAGLAWYQEALEYLFHVADMARVDQKSREVCSADQTLAGNVLHCAVIRPRYSGRRQCRADALGTP